jgi:PAS domain S-box-containing protein
LLTALGLVAGLDSVLRLRTGDHNTALLMVVGGLSYAAAWPIVTPVVRSGLAAPMLVIAVLAALVLSGRARVWVIGVLAAIVAAQAAWPLFGLGSTREALTQTIVSGGALFFVLLAVGLARGAVEASERDRREIFTGVPIGLFRLSRNGRITEVNPQLAAMLGQESDQLVGKLITELYDDPADVQILADDLETTGSSQSYTQRVRRADGSHAVLRGNVQTVRDPEGSILYYAGAVEDLTERLAMEERAHAEADRFQSVFDLAPIAIWEQDWSAVAQGLDELRAQGVSDLRAHLATYPDDIFRLINSIRFTDVNPAGMRIIGARTRQEAFDNVVHRDSPPEVIESLVTQLEAMWLGLDRASAEFIGQSVDNEPLDITLIWGVGRTQEGVLDPSRVIVVLADVSEARVAQRQLASLIESKDELVASVSHELRTPISSIMGMAHELHDRGEEFSDEERAELLAVIADQSREVANIVEDLLVATRADVESLTIRPELLLLADEIRRVVANEKSAVAVAIEADETTTAWVDPLRLRQILRNLLSNARRYGGDAVTVRVRTDLDRVVVEVADDGPGVPPGEEEAIFQPYTRKRSDQALPGSIGLGLSVSRRLARLMGGDLVYRPDQGSIFELSLPLPRHD